MAVIANLASTCKTRFCLPSRGNLAFLAISLAVRCAGRLRWPKYLRYSLLNAARQADIVLLVRYFSHAVANMLTRCAACAIFFAKVSYFLIHFLDVPGDGRSSLICGTVCVWDPARSQCRDRATFFHSPRTSAGPDERSAFMYNTLRAIPPRVEHSPIVRESPPAAVRAKTVNVGASAARDRPEALPMDYFFRCRSK